MAHAFDNNVTLITLGTAAVAHCRYAICRLQFIQKLNHNP